MKPDPLSSLDVNRYVREVFGAALLLTADPRALERYALPASSTEFLASVGLPRGKPFLINFGPVQELPAVGRAVELMTKTAHVTDEPVVSMPYVGESFNTLWVIRLDRDAQVWRVDLEGEQEDLFVNSRVELLGASLAAYAMCCRPPLPGVQRDRGRELSEQIARFDRHALEHPLSWWATVIEEVERDLL